MSNKFPKRFYCYHCQSPLDEPGSPLRGLGFDAMYCTRCKINYRRSPYNSSVWYVYQTEHQLEVLLHDDQEREIRSSIRRCNRVAEGRARKPYTSKEIHSKDINNH